MRGEWSYLDTAERPKSDGPGFSNDAQTATRPLSKAGSGGEVGRLGSTRTMVRPGAMPCRTL